MKNNLNKAVLKEMPNNKLIFTIDFNYKNTLQRVIVTAMEDFHGIPLEWEDFYYEFLSECKNLLDEYDEQYTLSTFLTSKCRFFVKNKCRAYMGNRFKTMNDYISQDEKFILRDSSIFDIPFDLSVLNRIEMKVYESMILDGDNAAECSKKLGLSRFKILNIYKNVLRKLKPQVEKN